MLHFSQSILSSPLNGSLRNFNTWRVSVGNKTLLRDFLVWTPKNLGPKTTYFRRLRSFRIDSVDISERILAKLYHVATEHYEEIFWVLAPNKIWGPKTAYCRRLRDSMATLRADISGKERDERQSGNGVGNYEGPPTSSQNFVNFTPLTAKNRTVTFTNPLQILRFYPNVTMLRSGLCYRKSVCLSSVCNVGAPYSAHAPANRTQSNFATRWGANHGNKLP